MLTPEHEHDEELQRGLLTGTPSRRSNRFRGIWSIFASRRLIAALVLGGLILTIVYLSQSAPGAGFVPVTPNLNVPLSVQANWAQYSPYHPVGSYKPSQSNCHITQANILQRHGARFPTFGASLKIGDALSKIQSVKEYTDSRLDFLKTFTYDLGSNDLVPFGAAQSFDSGQEAFERYKHIISAQQLPFVRASSSERVVLSALNWTEGFSAASHHVFNPLLAVVLNEAGNDTLDDHMCPSAGDADLQTSKWLSVYAAPITKFLNAGAPGANLTDTDTYSLISLCPFDTAAKETKSPFCNLFETEETAFPGFEFSGDLDKYYGTGYGQRLGPVQGVGYINELIARLTGQPVQDATQTNRTLDSSPVTFPLDRPLYADFSHDNQMIAIYAAMGLFNITAHPLDPSGPPPDGSTWRANALVPFSSRMVTERLSCGKETKVRIFVNDNLQPLEFCGAGFDGLCSLDDFVASQRFARKNGDGDFELCFE